MHIDPEVLLNDLKEGRKEGTQELSNLWKNSMLY